MAAAIAVCGPRPRPRSQATAERSTGGASVIAAPRILPGDSDLLVVAHGPWVERDRGVLHRDADVRLGECRRDRADVVDPLPPELRQAIDGPVRAPRAPGAPPQGAR